MNWIILWDPLASSYWLFQNLDQTVRQSSSSSGLRDFEMTCLRSSDWLNLYHLLNHLLKLYNGFFCYDLCLLFLSCFLWRLLGCSVSYLILSLAVNFISIFLSSAKVLCNCVLKGAVWIKIVVLIHSHTLKVLLLSSKQYFPHPCETRFIWHNTIATKVAFYCGLLVLRVGIATTCVCWYEGSRREAPWQEEGKSLHWE